MSSDDVLRWCPLVDAEELVMQSLGSFWKMDGGGYIFLFGCVPSFLRVFSRFFLFRLLEIFVRVFSRFFYFVDSKFFTCILTVLFISLTRNFLRVFSRIF
jgi:hypothetical protein